MNNFSIYKLITILFIFIISCNKQSTSLSGNNNFEEVTSKAKEILNTENLNIIPNLLKQPTYYLCYPKVNTSPGSITSYSFIILDASTQEVSTKGKVINGKVEWKNNNTLKVTEKKGIDQNGSNTVINEITIK